MAVTGVQPAIPASRLVEVDPSVLPAGGLGLQLNGVILTNNQEIPNGAILAFATAQDVANYFGGLSQEAALASVYFLGPNNKTQSPASLFIAQYPLTPIPGYLRGGPLTGMTLGQLQAVDASLTVPIDGSPVTGNINLASATSFSNAAQLMASQLALLGPQKSVITGSLSASTLTVTAVTGPTAASATTCSLSGTTLTVGGTVTGSFAVGQYVSGTGINPGTQISDLGTGTGGAGTYVLSQAATTEASETVTASWYPGVIALGDFVTGTGITTPTWISAFGSGSGGAGTYTLSTAATTESSEAINGYAPAVTFDALQNAFQISSGTTGNSSSAGYATGAAGTALKLTQALGAVIQTGTAGNQPDGGAPTAFMNTFVGSAQNWASFMTTWEPTSADKINFASWTNAQNNRYRYCMWETSVLDTGEGGPSPAMAAITASAYSGTVPIYQDSLVTTLNGEKAAFAMSWAACLDFTRLNGRQSIAFKGQSGLAADVTNATVANYLGGLDSNFGYGINYYGDFTTPNQAFLLWQRGFVTGPFTWDDTYTNQIWLNSQLRLAALAGLTTADSVPYANPGYALIESWLTDPIVAGVNFGMIVPGVNLSNAQITEANSQAGTDISGPLFQKGWYLQVLPAAAQARASRSSPPISLWYCDGGQVQRIVLASIAIQ